jgi:hypothetical protein
LATICGRGIDHDFLRRIGIWTYALKRSLRAKVSSGMNGTYWFPFATMYCPIKSGGIGRVPWTILGANIDTVCVHWGMSQNSATKELLNAACGVLSFKPRGSVKETVTDVLNSDFETNVRNTRPLNPFKEARDFIRKYQDPDRLRLATQAADMLENSRIVRLGNLRYDRLGFTIVGSAISASKQIRAAQFADKAQAFRDIGYFLRTDVTREHSADYKWVTRFDSKLGFQLPKRFDRQTSPFHSYQPLIEEMYLYYGIANSRLTLRLSPARILSTLRRDPEFPRTIRDETIIEKLSQPRVLESIQSIYTVLIAIGARPDLASKVANMFGVDAAGFQFRASIGGISLKDPVLSALDFSRFAHYRCVQSTRFADKSIDELVSIHLYAISILYYLRDGVARQVEPVIDANTLFHIRQDVLGPNFTSKLEELNSFYINSRRQSGVVQ